MLRYRAVNGPIVDNGSGAHTQLKCEELWYIYHPGGRYVHIKQHTSYSQVALRTKNQKRYVSNGRAITKDLPREQRQQWAAHRKYLDAAQRQQSSRPR